MSGKAIIVHSLEQARTALGVAGELGVPVTLASAPGAAATTGPAWFQEVVAQAAAAFPEVRVDSLLDCADRPGHVLAALRQGLGRVRFTGRKALAAKLAAIARDHDAELVTGALKALDLGDAEDPAAACRAWLGGG